MHAPSRPVHEKPQARSRKGLLIVPEFPYDSFWSYRHIIRLIGRKAAFPPLGLLTFAGYMPEHWHLEVIDLNVVSPPGRTLRRKIAEADAAFLSAMSIQKRSVVDILRGPALGLDTPFVLGGPFASSYRDQMLDPVTESDRVLHQGLDVLVWAAGIARDAPALTQSDAEVREGGSPTAADHDAGVEGDRLDEPERTAAAAAPAARSEEQDGDEDQPGAHGSASRMTGRP